MQNQQKRAEEKVKKSGAEENLRKKNTSDHARVWAGAIFSDSWVQTITTDQHSPEP